LVLSLYSLYNFKILQLRNLAATGNPSASVAKDPYSSSSGRLMTRNDIQKVNAEIMNKKKSSYCLNGGKMQLVYKDISLNQATMNQYDQKYLCTCPYNFIGKRCEECSKGYFGPHCHP